MRHPISLPSPRRGWLASTGATLLALLAACTTPPAPPPPTPTPAPTVPPSISPPAPGAPLAAVSGAANARDYRRDAAQHLYAQNAERIFKGKMPPLLYAIGVLQVEVDGRGRVAQINWMRAPKHAPEVIAEIERTVRQAAPFPAPVRLGHVTYTDTWLWHSSGRFQLDTLTEGQL